MSGEQADPWVPRSTAYAWPEGHTGPPARRTELAGRIAGVTSAMPAPMGDHHPAGTADTPMVMPLVEVRVSADRAQVIHVEPLYAGTGTGAAPVPARSPGHWAQLYAAGHP